MAISYANLPVPAGTGAYAYVGYFNSIREAISRRAAQIGAAVTLPDTIVAGDDVYTKFGPWLKKCRVAIEAILTAGKYGHIVFPGAFPWVPSFVLWTKASLIDYIQNHVPEWVLNPFSQFHNWMDYWYNWEVWPPVVTDTPLYQGYVNEIYYALELLCMTSHSIAPTAVTHDTKSGTAAAQANATAAYDVALADYAGKAFSSGVGDLYASGYATVSYNGATYDALYGADQETEWKLTIPNLSYPITRILVGWQDTSGISTDTPHYKRATAYNAKNFGGTIGQWMGYPVTPTDYQGYKYWSGLSWNNETRSFSHKWKNNDAYLYSERGTTFGITVEQSHPFSESILYTAFSGYLNEVWAPWDNDGWNLESE